MPVRNGGGPVKLRGFAPEKQPLETAWRGTLSITLKNNILSKALEKPIYQIFLENDLDYSILWSGSQTKDSDNDIIETELCMPD